MTKMLQAFLVLPALALTYLLFASAPVLRRWLHLLGAAAATTVLGSWWLVAVELWPAATRPWIGGSQRNSALELVLGYNGVGRLTGDQVGSVSTSRGWGHNTVLRLLDPGSGGQASWLLPAAALLGVLALWLTRGAREGHRARPAVVLWLTWTGVTWLVFSLMGGIFHDYYTVALAPGVASLVGLGSWVAWHHRGEAVVTRTLGAAVVVTGVMALVVLWPQRSWSPWLPWVVLALALVALWRVAHAHRRAVPVGAGFAAAALLAGLVGPAAYSVETAATPHSGAVPHAGPPAAPEPSYAGGPAPTPADPDGPSVGDLLTASRSSPALTRLLARDADRYTWVAAVTGANSAAGFQLATDRSVMPLGGFNGTDPAPSFAEFRRYVAQGRIHWFVSGGGRLVREEPDGEDLAVTRTGSSAAVRIERWVARTFPARVVDGVVVHDLTVPPARRLTGR
ncbi:hypothetical protein [Nocardioides litoris]|uniref:hypothetical protein n=1 Tax=Nocardioides litoris TaxID=1926648 RepID=UPI001B85E94E|nr:hypothetical protein [Nocardioides litoris]